LMELPEVYKVVCSRQERFGLPNHEWVQRVQKRQCWCQYTVPVSKELTDNTKLFWPPFKKLNNYFRTVSGKIEALRHKKIVLFWWVPSFTFEWNTRPH
jgi:hypothetical protein